MSELSLSEPTHTEPGLLNKNTNLRLSRLFCKWFGSVPLIGVKGTVRVFGIDECELL